MGGEAGGVKNQLRLRGGAGGECRFFPMATDNEQGFWRRGQRGSNRLEKALSRVPCVGWTPCPIHEEAGTATVREKDGWLTFGVGGHCESPAHSQPVCRRGIIC